MKKVIGVTTAAMFSLGLFTSTADAATMVHANVLNVRQGPGTDTSIIGTVTKGQQLHVVKQANGWTQITYNGKTAYVSSKYTKEAADASVKDTAVKATAKYYVNATSLNVRTGPARTHKAIGKLRDKQEVTVVKDAGNGWLQIQYKGKAAYVSARYVQAAPAPAPAPTPVQVKEKGETHYVKATRLNVRSGAGRAHKIVGKLNNGQDVQVVKEAGNGWLQIQYNGSTAYVSKQYVVPAVPAAAEAAPGAAQEAAVQEMYMEATAYTAHTSKTGITKLGYNVRENPHLKIIAVDPAVIPLGSKVWVEGYGEAIAGDTGGLIKGNKIDVFYPELEDAIQWGRKTVKVKVLH